MSINLVLGQNGIFKKSIEAKEENQKQTAIEIMNLKITNVQIACYAEKEELLSLQYLADKLCEDNEIAYVNLGKSEIGAVNTKISIGTNTSIFTKLEQYPYEFEINSSLQLESINGMKISTSNPSSKLSGTKTITKNGEYNISNYEKVNVNVPTSGEGTFWKKDHITFSSTSNSMKYTCGFKPSVMILDIVTTTNYTETIYTIDAFEHVTVVQGNTSYPVNVSTYYTVTDDGIEFTNWGESYKGCSIDIFLMK